MVIPFRRSIWSNSLVSGISGDDGVFVTLWSGHRAGVVGFRVVFWALEDNFHGSVLKAPAAQASHNAMDWLQITLDPLAFFSSSNGLQPYAFRYHLTNERHLPHLRIGLLVGKLETPTGSALQTVEGYLTLIGEAV